MRKQLIVAVIGLGAIAFALWWFFGQRRPADPTAGAHKTSEMLPKEILTQEQVIRVAKDTWRAAKGVELGEGTPIEVSLDVGKNEYTVLFKTPVLPPGSRGADYKAKFAIDATTGTVTDFLVGS